MAEAVSRTKSEVSEAKVFGIAADLTTEAGFNTLITEVPEVDILVNNVCIYVPVDFFESTDENWLKIFNINVLSGIRLTRFYMPKMLTSNWGLC